MKFIPWEEVLYYGENGFYMKRYVPAQPNHYKEQINLGFGWETLCYIVAVDNAKLNNQ